MRSLFKVMVVVIILGVLLLTLMGSVSKGYAGNQLQQPTLDIPTVTGTPEGPMAVVYSDPVDQINVRAGPGVEYPNVGVLLNRQSVPAIGRTPGGLWVQIIYLGVEGGVAWVYAPLVRVTG